MSRIESLKVKAKLLVKAKKKAGQPIPLKEALDKVAKLSGYPSWRELRRSSPENDFYWKGSGSVPNHWCKSHGEAQRVLEQNGGFLIPYLKQFFVCQGDFVEGLGISLKDPDLSAVGPDWASPRDKQALDRLNAKIKKAAGVGRGR